LGTIFIICITVSFCTPAADQSQQSKTASPDEENSATPLEYGRTETVQALFTQAAEVKTKIANSNGELPIYYPMINYIF